MNGSRIAALAILGLVGILALGWIFTGNDFFLYQYFAPRVVGVQSKVFHESQQYNDGMIRDLENLRMSYLAGTPAERAVLKGTILHRFAGYDEERLTPELRSFYESLRH
jgi:hypothetical protein